jgi:acyl-CoA thioester hydrolase
MFVTKIRPRVSETDGVGHINNTTIPIWFESGRDEIFRLFTPDLSFRNWKLVLVNMNIDFIKETFYGREVEVRTWIKKIGNTSFQIEEELFQDGELRARGHCTYVHYNFAERKPEPIPPHIREQLEQHLR